MNGHQTSLLWLYRALKLSDWLGRRLQFLRKPPEPRPFQPGLSVLIPERANPLLLRECLASVDAACRQVAEPCQVIVVVNGSARSLYEQLLREHPQVRWIFSPEPLWYGGAVRRGLRAAHYDWVYLLNNDMVLDPSAFSSLLPWRSPRVFGIASQIYFRDPQRRREETGWTVCHQRDGMIEIRDDVAGDDCTVRGTFYPGGGASLFRRDLLAHMAKHTSVYAPFYWEDVEWGTCAWRLGYESLYCPFSKAWHWHRQTNLKFFSGSEIDRILNRNRFIYHLRNGPPAASLEEFQALLAKPDEASLAEILTHRRILEIVTGRLRNCSCWFSDPPLENTWQRLYTSIEKVAS